VVLLGIVVAFARVGLDGAAVWLALSVPLGVLAPALGPSMRAQWRWFTEDADLRRTAYSYDSVGEETLYLIGPMIAAGVLAMGPARWGVALVAVLAVAGAIGLAASPAAHARADLPQRWLSAGPVRRAGMARLLASMACFGAGTALVYTGVASAADRLGHPGWAGLVEAGIAAGSVIGGLLWARRRRPLPDVPVLLGALAVLLLLAAWLPFAAGGALLAVGGVAIAPTYVAAFQTADRLVPDDEHTEASTLVNTATNLSISLGTAMAGAAIAAGASPYLLAGVAFALAAPLARISAR
jgi:predicted MFS family arabinose efflux permease